MAAMAGGRGWRRWHGDLIGLAVVAIPGTLIFADIYINNSRSICSIAESTGFEKVVGLCIPDEVKNKPKEKKARGPELSFETFVYFANALAAESEALRGGEGGSGDLRDLEDAVAALQAVSVVPDPSQSLILRMISMGDMDGLEEVMGEMVMRQVETAMAMERDGDPLSIESLAQASESARHSGAIAAARSVVRAVDMYETAVGLNPDDAAAHTGLSRQYARQDMLPEAREAAQTSVDKALTENELIAALTQLGDVERASGDLDAAWAAYEQSHEAISALRETGAPLTREQNVAAHWGLRRHAALALEKQDYEAAKAYYEQARIVASDLLAGEPDNPMRKRALAEALENLALVAYEQQDWEGALPLYEQALGLREELRRIDPFYIAWRRELVTTYGRMGEVLEGLGETGRALSFVGRAAALAETVASEYPDVEAHRETFEALRARENELRLSLSEA